MFNIPGFAPVALPLPRGATVVDTTAPSPAVPVPADGHVRECFANCYRAWHSVGQIQSAVKHSLVDNDTISMLELIPGRYWKVGDGVAGAAVFR